MNVIFAANDLVYSGLELAIYTLMKHNRNVNIYVLTMDISIENPDICEGISYHSLADWQRAKLLKIVKYFDHSSHLTFINAEDLYLKYLDESVNKFSTFTPYASLRLLVDKLLPFVDNAFYFDCDVAITGDIRTYCEMYCHQDIYYGAYVTPDACEGKGEMISGVMFMNIRKMRDGFLERARCNYCNNEYRYPDQMALRDAGDPVRFPATLGYCDSLDEFEGLPLIIHFTNQIGPKIYTASNRTQFFRKYSFLQYADDGIYLLDTF